MKKLSYLKGLEDCYLFLVKFTKQKYVNDILDGKLYMNNLKYFIELENKTHIKGQGDRFEAGNVMNNVTMRLYKSGTKKLISKIPIKRVTMRYNFYEKIPVFCLTVFGTNDFDIFEETNKSCKIKLNINDTDKNNIINNFGEKAVIIRLDKFIDKIEKYNGNNSNSLIYGKVHYEDYNVNSINRYKNYANDSLEVLFTKDIYFSPQREFRIISGNNYTNDYFVANIGTLRDGGAYVLDTDEFLNRLEFELNFIK
ncbi:hypothetical protein ACFHWD_20465 [Clostridium sp. MT-14]|uniref:hypothetical protein n=1 Tax=Clostridium sp. MT-14 TaxID=3348360 RepID=UPI0035F35352